MQWPSIASASLACLFLAGCASSQDTPGDDGGGAIDAPPDVSADTPTEAPSSRDAGDAGSDGDAAFADASDGGPADAGGDGWSSPCPAASPMLGSSCASYPVGLACSWGDDLRFGCRTEMWCDFQTTTWQWFTGDPFFYPAAPSTCPGMPPACPASPPAAGDGGSPYSPCTPDQEGLTCVYGTTAYTCGDCMGGLCLGAIDDAGHSGPNFRWYTSVLDPQCGTAVPNWGDPCASPGLVCNLNQCIDDEANPWAHGTTLVCNVDGVWQSYNADLDAGGSCP